MTKENKMIPYFHGCRFPWEMLQIGATGYFGVCCGRSISKINTVQDVKNIWMNDNLRTIREELSKGICPSFCRDCVWFVKFQNIRFIEEKCLFVKPNELKNPISLGLNITDKCNLKCFFCKGDKYVAAEAKSMDMDIYREIAKIYFETAKNLNICGAGELFVYEHLIEALNVMKESYSGYADINSNGSILVDEALWKLVIETHNMIMFSIDSATEEMHYKLRKFDWASIFKNIENIKKVRKEINKDFTYGFSMVLMKDNLNEMVDFVKKSIGDWGGKKVYIQHISGFKDRSVLNDIVYIMEYNRLLKEVKKIAEVNKDVSFSLPDFARDEKTHIIEETNTNKRVYVFNGNMNKSIIFIGFGKENSWGYRTFPFIQSCKRYLNNSHDIFEYSNIGDFYDNIGDDNKFGNYLVFLSENCIVRERDMCRFFLSKKCFKNKVVLCYDQDGNNPASHGLDTIIGDSICCIFLYVHKKNVEHLQWYKEKSVSGIGFLHYEKQLSLQNIPKIEFSEKQNILTFIGSISGSVLKETNARLLMFERLSRTNKIEKNFHISDIPDWMSGDFRRYAMTLVEDKGWMDFTNYGHELNKSKYCLCPFGAGLGSYRFFEAMSMGTIPISPNIDDFSDLGLFKSFVNYIPMGEYDDDCKGSSKIEDVILLLSNTNMLEQIGNISNAAVDTYEKYIRINEDCSLQKITFDLLIKLIASKIGDDFFDIFFNDNHIDLGGLVSQTQKRR